MLTFLVMPCLDEESLIARTIASLGFLSEGDLPDDAHLIVVDNGSTDGTCEILKAIRSGDPKRVHLLSERERGYVPPRRRGVIEAELLAGGMAADPEDVMILQVDADTTYKRGYVAAMQAAATERGTILEGATHRPPEFEAAHPSFVAAEHMVDDTVERFDAADEDEVVIDDKIAGYHLADYLQWGGLFEEYTPAGDPIHAETTRMFIRAKSLHGAQKRRVNPAGAAPSRRKVLERPWLHFATVGFPREASWIRNKMTERGQSWNFDVDGFGQRVLDGLEAEAVLLRRGHQLALFRYLPALVARALGSCEGQLPSDVTAVLSALPQHDRSDLVAAPGQVLMNVLGMIDRRPTLFSVSPG